MKIFGLEVNRASRATEPNPGVSSAGPVSIEKANQKTLPSVPLANAFPKADLGDSGTRMLHGIITDEYLSELQGIQGIRIYDEMRKSDGTVAAAIRACTLPIRRAEFFIKPGGDTDQDKEIATFVERALWDWLEDMTFDDFLRQALLMLPFGVMLFEKVYGIKEFDGKEYVTLKKLAPRLPKSVLQWELPDRTFGVQQIRQDGILAMIPGSKLLIFVNEREGDNWWGVSLLRAAYKHWYFKNNFYKIDAIAFERQGLGVPTITMPQGYTDSDEKKAVQTLQNLRASENAYLVLPPDYKAEFLNMGANTTRDPNSSIEHHNKQILQSVLAQFLELGVSKAGSGSRALSQDHSDLFLKAEEAIAMTFISEVNRSLIPELVDLNFPPQKQYPILDYSGISKIDVEILGNAYSSLVSAGAITPTDADQQWIRAAIGLPPRTADEIDEANQEDPTGQDLLEQGVVEDTGAPADANAVADAAAKVDAKKKPTQDQKKTPIVKKKVETTPPAEAAEPRRWKRRFAEGGEFKSWRQLTMAEGKVNFKAIQDAMNKIESDFSVAAKNLLSDAKDSFMANLHDALSRGDTGSASALEIGFITDYQNLIYNAMLEAYNFGKVKASNELGVPHPQTDRETLLQMQMSAKTIAEKTAQDLESKAKIAAVNDIKQAVPALQSAGSIDGTLDEAIAKAVDDTAGVISGQGINNGRNDVFSANEDKIRSLQRSEVLDDKTCDFCLSMDGRVVEAGSKEAGWDTFHGNCRGIWVAIMENELNPPEITGIPDNLSAYYGGQTNSLIQPPKPIVRSDSPAADEAKRRKEEG